MTIATPLLLCVVLLLLTLESCARRAEQKRRRHLQSCDYCRAQGLARALEATKDSK